MFRELEKQSGYSIIYKSSEVNLKEVLSVDVSKEPLENVLNKVLRKQGLTYEIKDEHIIIYKAKANKEIHAVIKQQNKKISGVVKDAQGEPMIGVSVLEEGTQNGTVTDFNGNYVLEVQNGKAALVFSYIGYVSKKVSIGNLSVVNVALDEDVQRLDDVVVVGYAIGNKRSVSVYVMASPRVAKAQSRPARNSAMMASALARTCSSRTALSRDMLNT